MCIGNFGNTLNAHLDATFDFEKLVPKPFRDGVYLEPGTVPPFSAYSQNNIQIEEPIKRDVIYMNYGRLEDYEDLLLENTGKLTKQSLENDIVIVRYVTTL